MLAEKIRREKRSKVLGVVSVNTETDTDSVSAPAATRGLTPRRCSGQPGTAASSPQGPRDLPQDANGQRSSTPEQGRAPPTALRPARSLRGGKARRGGLAPRRTGPAPVLLDTEGGGGGLTEGSRDWAAQPLSNQRGKRRPEPARVRERSRLHASTLRPPREWPVGPLPTPPACHAVLSERVTASCQPALGGPRRAPLSSTFRTRVVELGTAGTRPEGGTLYPGPAWQGRWASVTLCTRARLRASGKHSQGICSHSGTSRFQWLLDT